METLGNFTQESVLPASPRKLEDVIVKGGFPSWDCFRWGMCSFSTEVEGQVPLSTLDLALLTSLCYLLDHRPFGFMTLGKDTHKGK